MAGHAAQGGNMHAACHGDNCEMPPRGACEGRTDSLTQRDIDVHKRDKDGCTAAHHAAAEGDKEALLALLDSGCEINATDRCNMTPLMHAAGKGQAECAQLLIQRGADVNKRDKDGRTAAHWAARRGDREALLALLDAGCEIDVIDSLDMTPARIS